MGQVNWYLCTAIECNQYISIFMSDQLKKTLKRQKSSEVQGHSLYFSGPGDLKRLSSGHSVQYWAQSGVSGSSTHDGSVCIVYMMLSHDWGIFLMVNFIPQKWYIWHTYGYEYIRILIMGYDFARVLLGFFCCSQENRFLRKSLQIVLHRHRMS